MESTTPSRRLLAVLGGLLAVLLPTGGLAAVAVAKETDRHPDRWDPRVADLVAFVERERGREFVEPVHVDFLDEHEWQERHTIDADAHVSNRDRAGMADAVAEARALGLLDGDVDLRSAIDVVQTASYVGVYSPRTKRISVRGGELTPDVEVTLVHELTHALDDQHHGLDRLRRAAGPAGTFGVTALIEGSASRVEAEYLRAMSTAEFRRYVRAVERRRQTTTISAAAVDGDAGDDVELDVPQALADGVHFPYVLGPQFVDAVIRSSDDHPGRVLDRLFASPPDSDEKVAMPERYLTEDETRRVRVPPLRRGEEMRAPPTTAGMLGLAGMLVPAIGFDDAWDALAEWSGDSVMHYRRSADGATCVRIDVAFDSVTGRDAFVAAATRWAEGRPASAAPSGALARLDACDPGADGPKVKAMSPSLIDGLTLRGHLFAMLTARGFDDDEARCIRDEMFRANGAPYLWRLASVLQDGGDRFRDLGDAIYAGADACGATSG